jgi:hypothetical protein
LPAGPGTSTVPRAPRTLPTTFGLEGSAIETPSTTIEYS